MPSDDPTHSESSSSLSDITDVMSVTRPPKKPPEGFSFVLRRLILLIIGGIVAWGVAEYFVETPLSKYVERYTGPRMRTLQRAWQKGEAEYVYRGVRPKFAADPSDRGYRELFTHSSSALLTKYISDRDWDKARTLLEDATSVPRIPADVRVSLRRMYLAAMPNRFLGAFRSGGGAKDLEVVWLDVEKLAAAEPNDAEVQYEAGCTLAAYILSGKTYNPASLRYFETFLRLKPDEKGREPIPAIVENAITESLGSEAAQRGRKLIEEYYSAEFLPKLKAYLDVAPFGATQTTETTAAHNQRQNAHRVLVDLKKNEAPDDFRFHLVNVLNAQNFGPGDDAHLKESTDFMRKAESPESLRPSVRLPKLLPIGILAEASASPRFKEVRTLVFGKLSSLEAPYCHERLFSPDSLLSKNCHDLLASSRSLTSAEKRKWSATQRKLPLPPGGRKAKVRKRSY
ncbi:MAG: hypothetical protein V1798_01825 [Pseudomonadota bacterium]